MLKNNLEEKLDEIYRVITNEYHNNNQVSTLTGLTGLSIFLSYYCRYKNINDEETVNTTIINNSIAKINEGYSYPSFCSGIAGLGWGLDHLEQEGFINVECDDLLPNFDDYLYNAMISDLSKNHYDYLHGAIGYAFYFFKRYKNTQSQKLKKKYTKILFNFINALEKLSKPSSNNTLKWASFAKGNSELVYNLSLSHGMSSIIGILTKLHYYDDFKEATGVMLQRAINYILKFKKINSKNQSIFPNVVPAIGEVEYSSRMAWCYGDLGIGIRLWHASKVLKNENLKDTSLKILKDSSKRRIPENTLVVDAGICHGSFGVAQIYNCMYRETKLQVFKETSEFWIKDGLSKAVFKDGLAGYKQWKGNEYGGWVSEISILEGVAGIGLVILDYLTGKDNNWDECLMIS
ncbi:lanthionine synthetase C family protein [Tenacibaculum sp. 190524A02b]